MRVFTSSGPHEPAGSEGGGGIATRAGRRDPRGLVAFVAAAGALLGLGHAALIWSLDGLPYQDVPNHLARAVIAADLLFDGGRRFGEAFSFELAFSPYLLGDLALASLVEALGPYAAARAWTIAVVASLPVAVAVYLRTAGYSRSSVAIGTVVAIYFSTDWFFLMGFQAFKLAVALTLLTAAAWRRWMETGSAAAFLGCTAGLVAGYLAHLSALVFGAVVIAVMGALALGSGRASLSRLAIGAVPLAALLAWQLAGSDGTPGGASTYDPVLVKLVRTLTPFRRYALAADGALLALLGAATVLLAAGWRRVWRRERVLVPAALALVFLGLYAAMPLGRFPIWYIDVRALPFVAVFGLLALLAVAEERGRSSWAVAAVAVGLAAANLGVLHRHLPRHDAAMREYREIAAEVPDRATVFTLATRQRTGAANPYLHAGTFATIESRATTPYLFIGGVTSYFRARYDVPPAPSETWYIRNAAPPDPETIAGTYEYVLTMKPYEPDRLPVRAEVVAQNGSAALLRIAR